MQESGFSDGALITGFISAFRQFGKEMVTSESQISNSTWENQPGGSKRLIFHTTWGKEVSSGVPEAPQIPEISTICQVGGPALTEVEYTAIEKLVSDLNDEIIYRMMLGEVFLDRTIEPIVAVDILTAVLENVPEKTRNRMLGKVETEAKVLEQLLDEELQDLFKNDKVLLEKFLSKVPLQSSCDQEEFESAIGRLVNYVEEEIHKFYEAEDTLQRAREKVRGGENTFSQIREEYRRFQDKRLTFLQNKNVLCLSLETPHHIFAELRNQLKDLTNQPPLRDFFQIQQDLPRPEVVEGLMIEAQSDASLIPTYQKYANFDIEGITQYLATKNVNGEVIQKFTILKEKLLGFVELLKHIASLSDGTENRMLNLQGSYLLVCQEDALATEGNLNDAALSDIKEMLSGEIDHTQANHNGIPDNNSDLEPLIITLRSNLVTYLINSLYERVLNQYNRVKYALVYNGNLKRTVLTKVVDAVRKFTMRIQDFSFAALFEKVIKKVKRKQSDREPVKAYSIDLITSYLNPFLRRNFKKDPFLIDHDNPIIAIDTYSRRFCSEIVKGVGLEQDFYEESENLPLPRRYVESFVQIFDSAGITHESVIQQLRDAKDILLGWVDQVEDMINALATPPQSFHIKSVVEYCEKNLIVDPSKYQTKEMVEKVNWRNDLVKNVIFRGKENPQDIIALYNTPREIARTLQELEDLTKNYSDDKLKEFYRLFISKNQYDTVVKNFKTLLVNALVDEKTKIQEFLKRYTQVLSEEKGSKKDEVLNIIGEVEDFFSPEKIREFKAKIERMTGEDRLSALLTLLDQIDNDYLNLKRYAHVKGIIKNITSPEEVKESPVQKEAEAQGLLLEALIQTYSKIHEDYFGKLLPGAPVQSTGRGRSKTTVQAPSFSIEPGRIFLLKYNLAEKQVRLYLGLHVFMNLFTTITGGNLKSKNFRLTHVLNYLASYVEDGGYGSPEEMIMAFAEPKTLEDFLNRYTIQKVKSRKGEIKTQLQQLYEQTEQFVFSKTDNPPPEPSFEITMLGMDQVDMLRLIIEHSQKKDRIHFRDGKNAPKGHVARDANFKKLSKKFVSDLEKLDDLDSRLEDDIKDFWKNYKYSPANIPPWRELLNQAAKAMRAEMSKLDFISELDLPGITKIRLSAYLDTQRYVVPQEVTAKLVNEGKLNRKYIDGVVKTSVQVGAIHHNQVSKVLSKTPIIREVLEGEVKTNHGPERFFGFLVKVPEAIAEENLIKIFGPKAEWIKDETTGKKSILRGFHLLFNDSGIEKETYGEVMNAYVSNLISKELQPVFAFLNQYSQKIHSGFERVYNALFAGEIES